MRVDVRSYYSVDRPPVKFHRIRNSFDASTINYSGNIVGQIREYLTPAHEKEVKGDTGGHRSAGLQNGQ